MYYKNCETYLNEEVRKPIKKALEKGDKKEVMEAVDYLCERYRELCIAGKFYEEKYGVGDLKEYLKYHKEHMKRVDYDKLESPFTDEELEAMESADED